MRIRLPSHRFFSKLILIFLVMIFHVRCSAVEDAIKNAAKDVGEELAEDVGEQIEDKLSTASEEIQGEISGIKDDMKAEMEAALALLRDELGAKVGDLNSTLAALKDTLPAEVSQQLDKLVTVVDGIKSVDDLTHFFDELSELDSKMASLEESMKNEVTEALQPLHETLNQYDIEEFKSTLDGKTAGLEQFITDKTFELKDELQGQITKVRESLTGLDNLRDVAFANNTLVSVTQIISEASSDEDYREALQEIVKLTGDVIEGVTDVVENINSENLAQVAQDAVGAVASADVGNVNVDVNVNVNQNPSGDVTASPTDSVEPVANDPVVAAITAPEVDQGGQNVCEDYPAEETSVLEDPCNPNITNWNLYTIKGHEIKGQDPKKIAITGINKLNFKTLVQQEYPIPSFESDVSMRTLPTFHHGGLHVYLGAINKETINAFGGGVKVWVKSGVKVNVKGGGKRVYFENGAIVNGEVMTSDKNYSWTHHCENIQPHYENCVADLERNYQIIEDSSSASNVSLDIPNVWVKFPVSGGPLQPGATLGTIKTLILDEGSGNQHQNGNLVRYAGQIFVLPGAKLATDEWYRPVYFLPGSESDIYPVSGVGSSWGIVGTDSEILYGPYINGGGQAHNFKSIFMCRNIRICRTE